MSHDGPPEHIFLIRHAEKPDGTTGSATDPAVGIDLEGKPDNHSLIPRGWQRSGALAVLFVPAAGPLRDGLAVPDHLFSPSAKSETKTTAHRTYQTVLGVSGRANLTIETPYGEGDEQALADSLVRDCSGNALICWEHHRIPALAAPIPVTDATAVPTEWPDDRFDLIWSFTLAPGRDPTVYIFRQIPQLLLKGDSDKPIASARDE